MDERRLSTQEIFNSNIIDKIAPVTDIPETRQHILYDSWNSDSAINIPAELIKGSVVRSSECYGLTYIWGSDADSKYHGVLLQYREVTERHTFDSQADCIEWFLNTTRKCS